MTAVAQDDLLERAGVLPFAKLREIDDALQLAEEPQEQTPEATARLSGIKDALRLGCPE